jgi:uncharacterized RDD family membrane protein YckC
MTAEPEPDRVHAHSWPLATRAPVPPEPPFGHRPVAPPQPPLVSPYAGLATRVVAFAADAVVINVVGWVTAAMVTLGLSLLQVPDDVQNILLALGSVIALIWFVSYFVFFWSTTGQTPGDRLMRIRVDDARTGDRISPRRALLRFFGLFLAALPLCAGFLLILVDDRRRGLHDRLARTVVADTRDDPVPAQVHTHH